MSIKFRPTDVKKTAHRIDRRLQALRKQGDAAVKGSPEAEEVASQIFAREELVSTIYQQVRGWVGWVGRCVCGWVGG